MKYFLSILFLSCIFMQACICSPDPECRANPTLVRLYDYQTSDLDSVLIQEYHAGKQFNEFVQEYTIMHSKDSIDQSPYIYLGLDIHKEYRVTVLRDGNSFEISGLSFIQRKKKRPFGCLGYSKILITRNCPFSSIRVSGPKASVDEEGIIYLSK